MKKIGDKHTNNIFENIKYIDEYGNEYWLTFLFIFPLFFFNVVIITHD